MNYGKLEKKSQFQTESLDQPKPIKKSTTKLKPLLIIGFTLIVAAALAVTLAVTLRPKSSGNRSGSMTHPKPTKAISRVCSRTLYQNLCVNSFLDFPGSLVASDKQLVHISVNMTLQRVGRAYYSSTDINNVEMSSRVRSAYNDCLELLEDSVDQLQSSLTSVSPSGDNNNQQRVGSTEDVMTWLSASLTNHDTCTEGLTDVEDGQVKELMTDKLKDLSELVSNSLAIYSASSDDNDLGAIPIENRRRRLMSSDFPDWVSKKDRRLMEMPAGVIQADVIVSKDGKNGTCKTIEEAIKKAPQKSSRRFIIYIMAGR